MEAIVSAFAARGAVAVVVACNAASTAFPGARVPEGLPVLDVVSAGVALVRAAGHREIGLVGGVRTVRSRAHARRLEGVRVVSRIAQPLSAMVERGELSGAAVSAEVRRVVADLRSLPAVLLACTHYPALLPVFRRELPGVALLDPAAVLAAEVRASGVLPEGEGEPRFYTTGDADGMRRSALAAFGVTLGPVRSARALVGVA
jgi:glutamate racemase